MVRYISKRLLLLVPVLLGVSLPSFWFGIMLMQLFSLKVKLLPPSGTGTWQHMVLPRLRVSPSSPA